MRTRPSSNGGMSSTSSIRSSIRRRSVPVPTIECPDCGLPVKQWLSNTNEHDGWVFYCCRNHGKWDLEYVEYLIDQKVLVGDDAAEAFGAADEKRDVLKDIREAKAKAGSIAEKRGKIVKRTGPAVAANGAPLSITKLQAASMLALGREIVLLMKCIIGTVLLLSVICVLLVLKK
ncbi:unnamed protein product [Alopecurus aequalis]